MQQFCDRSNRWGFIFYHFVTCFFGSETFFSIHWQQTKQTKVAAEAQAHALSAQATSDMMCAEGN